MVIYEPFSSRFGYGIERIYTVITSLLLLRVIFLKSIPPKLKMVKHNLWQLYPTKIKRKRNRLSILTIEKLVCKA